MKSKKVSKKESLTAENKEKRIKWIPVAALAIIIIMVGSSLVLMKNSGDSYDYNGFSITKTDNGWLLTKGQGSLPFSYDPKSLENIHIENLGLTNVYKVYTIIDQNASQETELLKNYLNNLGIIANDACFNENNCPDVPIVNCNSTTPILYFSDNNISISKDSNCIILSSPQADRIKVVDAFVYKLLGVL